MDKQIEELAKVLCPSYENKKDCETCPTEWCQAEEYAVMTICNGYRKIPEIPKNTVLTNNDIAELLSIVARDTRKKTAKKFAERLKKKISSIIIELKANWATKEVEGFAKDVHELTCNCILNTLNTVKDITIDEIAKEITEGEV